MGTDVLQLGLPCLDALFLFEGLPEQVIRAFLDARIWMVGIDFRLHFHVDRRPELRGLVEDLEPVLVDLDFIVCLESLFIDRNYIRGDVLT